MGSELGSASHDERDDDDDEEYEEEDGGNRFLGFMFGNVDNSGDLDVDYLDEDAKEHLAALAEKLGHSLTEINLSVKSRQTPADAAEQDYDEKAEDAVDYEDIDEQYEGPETQAEAVTEEDYLLPKKEYFSAEASRFTLGTSSVFDDENYDEDEEIETEPQVEDTKVEVHTIPLSGDQDEHHEVYSERGIHIEDDQQLNSLDTEDMECAIEESLEEACEAVEEPIDGKGSIPLPILCIEDGMVILQFSEIFGVNEPLKKGERRDHRHSFPKERHKFMDASNIVEEDEEEFLKGYGQGFHLMKQTHRVQHDNSVSDDGDDLKVSRFGVVNGVATMSLQDDQAEDSCLSEEPMKEDPRVDLSAGWQSPLCPKFHSLDQQDWEDKILWDNSPAVSDNSAESCEISGPDLEDLVIRETDMVSRKINHQSELDTSIREIDAESVPKDHHLEFHMEPDKENHSSFLHSFPVTLESFGSKNFMVDIPPFSESRFHPQLLRLESRLELDDHNHIDARKDNVADEVRQSNAMRRFGKLALQNRDIMEGSWLDNIIWEPHKPISKPKLILDLQDEQMLFEIPNNKEGKHLCLHAGAMISTRSLKSSSGDCLELPGLGGKVGWRNIGNDDFYSKRKTSHQLKSDSKKRAVHGARVYHSIPALKLQTMKLKLSNKDVSNFHRPKALWYPHDNEVAVKEQGKLPTQGPMKVLLKSLGGKGSKVHVDADETVSSLTAKASKKLDFKLSENVKIYYLGKELEDQMSLAIQGVQPNSMLHLVRTKIHLLPRAQKLPGENKSLRPPGAFKKKSDLSAKDGHVFLMEYCEERPLLLSNAGMGARLCTYYQKSSPGDQIGALVHNGNNNLGSVMTLDPADKSPFLGDIKAGFSQSSLETSMYRAPVFPHKVPTTDYLLVRSAKGKLSIRRIDRIHVVGQQEPLKEVMSPGTKGFQSYMSERLFVYVCRYFREQEKRGLVSSIRVDELSNQFPYLSEANIRKRLKDYAYLQRDRNGKLLWVMKRNSRIPPEEELRRKVSPEDVCIYESMQAGLYRLKHLGITRLTQPTGISSAMSQLPDEAIALAAASHIERELQITPWNLSSNFVACTNQDRENFERLEITGVGDPSGRGLGFSYVRTAPKAPMASAIVKKKTAAARGGSTVTGTDADLRRLSMEAAREVLLKFNVPDEHIAKQTRWHRIALIRKLSSEQAASGVKVDPTTISKYARGQRMSFLQLQQQTREKCQEIWDRQVQCLSAVDGDENESESEANSLDSFAGDLENLLDAEECEDGEEGNVESKLDKVEGVKGLKMRRHASLAQAEEEIEDEAAEAAELFKMLLDDNEGERKKKKKARVMWEEPGLAPSSQSSFGFENSEPVKKNAGAKKMIGMSQPSSSYTSKENIARDSKAVESYLKRSISAKAKPMRKNDISQIGLPSKKVKIVTDGIKSFKEKKSARERFACGACGQVGHMKTNKNCPRYRENIEPQDEATDYEKASGKSNTVDPSSQAQQKTKKLLPKAVTKNSLVEGSDGENITKKAKVVPLKFKCGSTEILSDKASQGATRSSDQPVTPDAETGNNSGVKVNKITFSSKMKNEDAQVESRKPSIFIRPPVGTDKGQVESHKPSLVIPPPANADMEHVEARKAKIVIRPPAEVEREQRHKKIVIRRPKEIIDVDQVSQDGSLDLEYRKTKRIVELSSFENCGKQETLQLTEESLKRKARDEKRKWEEEIRRRNEEKLRMERERRFYEESMLEEQEKLEELRRYQEDIRMEREEEEAERQKANRNKKKKKRTEVSYEYLEDDYQARRTDRRMPERDRGAQRRPVVELGRYSAEYASSAKRRRGGEVGLANILEGIVDHLKTRQEVSYLFIKPVSKKEAPDYYDIVKNPMDLSTMKDKARKMEYKNREEFRQDMYQITRNAHIYNDRRNPFIPPLADQLLELCDRMLIEHQDGLDEAVSGIENRND